MALVGAAVAALAIAARQALRTGYGLDRTDEGLYLLAMARPGDDPATVYLFGHLLAPLYRLLGGDVTGLRLAGGAAVAVLSAWLLHAAAEVGGARRWERALAAVVGGGAAAVAFAWFPMTPSYNTVALCGCLLVGIALAGAARPSTAPASTTAPNPVPPDATARADLRRAPRPTPLERGATDAPAPTRAAGPRPGARRGPGAGPAQGTAVRHLARTWGLAGVGVAMAGLGKPTSALAALLVVLLALLALGPARRVTTALLAVGVGVTTTAAAFVVIAGRAPADLSATLLAGSRGVRLLGGHEQLVRLDALVPSSWPAALGFGEPGAWTPTTLQVLLVLPLAALVALLLRLPARAQFGRWRATWRPTTSSSLSRAVVVVTLALLALPFAYVFGTNTNLWSGAGRGAPPLARGARGRHGRRHDSASSSPQRVPRTTARGRRRRHR